MKISKINFVLILFLLMFNACKDESIEPIITFTTAQKGTYPRLIEESDRIINLLDLETSTYNYVVEFVDEFQGKYVQEYILHIGYNDGVLEEFRRVSAVTFFTNEAGYQQAPEIKITAEEILTVLGLQAEDLVVGDQFKFKGEVILLDDASYASRNSSTTVKGSAFRSHFDFTLEARCPSNLEGVYNYTTTNTWCGANDINGTVEFIKLGDDLYELSDASFGTYAACYNCCTAQGITFVDECSELSFVNLLCQFGDLYTFSSEIDGEDWILSWQTSYYESAVTTINFPGGVPFSIK